MAWDSTNFHGYECTSTYQEELPYGNYVEENQYEYGERCQSWDMEYEYKEAYGNEEAYGYEGAYNYEDVYGYEGAYNHEEASPSPIYEQEDIYNLLELVLEGQESYYKNILSRIDAFEVALERDSRDMNIQEKSMDEGMLIDCHEDDSIITPPTPTSIEDQSSFILPCVIEKKEHKRLSGAEIEEIVESWDEESDKAQLKDLEKSSSISEESKEVGKDTIEDYPLSDLNAPKEELKYLPKEDSCEDVWGEERMKDTMEKSLVDRELSPKEHMQVQPLFEQETMVEKPKEKQDNLIEKVTSCNHLLIDECIDPPCESLDTVDYSLVQSTNLEIDFIFPPYAFIPQAYSKNHLRKYLESVNTNFVNTNFINTNFNKYLVLLVWTIVFLLAQMVYCENRRRTKGPLAQPFDSCD